MTPLSVPERVLQGLGITDPDDIDLEAIAWTMGAGVRYRPLDGCEARIIGRDDQAIITVNERSSWRRRRFSSPTKSGTGPITGAAASFAERRISTAAVTTVQ